MYSSLKRPFGDESALDVAQQHRRHHPHLLGDGVHSKVHAKLVTPLDRFKSRQVVPECGFSACGADSHIPSTSSFSSPVKSPISELHASVFPSATVCHAIKPTSKSISGRGAMVQFPPPAPCLLLRVGRYGISAYIVCTMLTAYRRRTFLVFTDRRAGVCSHHQ